MGIDGRGTLTNSARITVKLKDTSWPSDPLPGEPSVEIRPLDGDWERLRQAVREAAAYTAETGEPVTIIIYPEGVVDTSGVPRYLNASGIEEDLTPDPTTHTSRLVIVDKVTSEIPPLERNISIDRTNAPITVSSDVTITWAVPGTRITLFSSPYNGPDGLENRHFTVDDEATLRIGNGITLSGRATSSNSLYSGGIHVNSGGTLELQSGSILRDNRAVFGGAVRVDDGTLLASPTSVITNNYAIFDGGGVYISDSSRATDSSLSSFTLNVGSFTSNRADRDGGAIFTDNFNSITAIEAGATFSGNTAGRGAFNLGSGALTPLLTTHSYDPGVPILFGALRAMQNPTAGPIKTVSFSTPPLGLTAFTYLANNYDLNFNTESAAILPPIDDLQKTSGSRFSKVGDTLVYEISFTIPEDLTSYRGLLVYDDMSEGKLSYVEAGSSIKIDGVTVSGQVVPIVDIVEAAHGAISVYFTGEQLAYYSAGASEGKVLITVVATVNAGWTGGPITNKVQLFPRAGDSMPDPETDTPNPDEEKVCTVDPIRPVDYFEKDSEHRIFNPTEDIVYTISFRLPTDVTGYTGLLVFDDLNEGMLEYRVDPRNRARILAGPGAGTTLSIDTTTTPGAVRVYLTQAQILANAGAEVEITIVTRVNTAVWSSGPITNTAELYYQTQPHPPGPPPVQPNPEIDEPGETDDARVYPPLSNFRKTGTGAGTDHRTYEPGQNVNYSISFTLDNPESYARLRIVDNYDSRLTLLSTQIFVNGLPVASAPGPVGGLSPNPMQIILDNAWLEANVTPGALVDVRLTFSVNAGTTGVITNNAVVWMTPLGGNPVTDEEKIGEDDEELYPKPVAPADFSKVVSGTGTPKLYTADSNVSYTLSFTSGDPAGYESITIVDWFDEDRVTFVGTTAAVSVNGIARGTITREAFPTHPATFVLDRAWIAANLTAGDKVELVLTFNVKTGTTGDLTNRANIIITPRGGGDDVTGTPDEETLHPLVDPPTGFAKNVVGASRIYTTSPALTPSYSLSFVSGDPDSYERIVIRDTFDASKVAFTGTPQISVRGGTPVNLLPGQFTASTSGNVGTVTITLDRAWMASVNLAKGNAVAVTLSFTVQPGATGTIVNNASIGVVPRVPPGGPTLPEVPGTPPGDDETLYPEYDPPTNFTKTGVGSAGGTSKVYVRGQSVTYDLRFTLGDPQSYDKLTITDTFDPLKVNFTGAQISVDGGANFTTISRDTGSGSPVSFTLGRIWLDARSKGDVIVIRLTFSVLSGANGTIVNNATLTPTDRAGDDKTSLPGTDTLFPPAVLPPDFTKTGSGTGSGESYTAGQPVSYDLSFTLGDPNMYNSITVTDSFDASRLTYSNAQISVDGGVTFSPSPLPPTSQTANSVSFTLDRTWLSGRAAGNQIVVRLHFNVIAGVTGNIYNNATITVTNRDGNPGPTEPPVTVILYDREPVDVFEKTTNDSFSTHGTNVTFVVGFQIPDNVTGYQGMLVYDAVPSSLENVNASARILEAKGGTQRMPFPAPAPTSDFTVTGNNVSLYVPYATLNAHTGKWVEITITGDVVSGTTGDIRNVAGLYYHIDHIDGELTKPVPVDPDTDPADKKDDATAPFVEPGAIVNPTDFTKVAASGSKTYVPGINPQTVTYDISFTVPAAAALENYGTLTIVDEFDDTMVSFSSHTLTLGGSTIPGTLVTSTPSSLAVTFDAADLIPGQVLNLRLVFNVLPGADGTIVNNSKLLITPLVGGGPTPPPPPESGEEIPPVISDKPEDFTKKTASGSETYEAGVARQLTYNISYTVPTDPNLIHYTVRLTDTHDLRLSYVPNSLVISSGSSILSETQLTRTITTSGNTVVVSILGIDLIAHAGQKLNFALTFYVPAEVTGGTLINDAKLDFIRGGEVDRDPDPPADEEKVIERVRDFIKTVGIGTPPASGTDGSTFTKATDPVNFRVSFTMPSDIEGYAGLLILDQLDSRLTYLSHDLYINGSLVDSSDYESYVTGTAGALISVHIGVGSSTPITAGGATVVLIIKTTVNSTWETGNITNKATMYYQRTGDDPIGPGAPSDPSHPKEETPTVTVNQRLTVTYRDDGKDRGTPPTDSTLYSPGDEVTVLGPGSPPLEKDGAVFGGWRRGPTGPILQPGDKFNITENVELIPVWITPGSVTKTVVGTTGPYARYSTVQYEIRYSLPSEVAALNAINELRIVDTFSPPGALTFVSGSSSVRLGASEGATWESATPVEGTNPISSVGTTTSITLNRGTHFSAAHVDHEVIVRLTFTVNNITAPITNTVNVLINGAPAGPGDEATLYTVTYSPGTESGVDPGSVVPDDPNLYAPGTEATVLGNPGNISRPGYVFGGWRPSPGTGVYRPGDKYTVNDNTVFVPVWIPDSKGDLSKEVISIEGLVPVPSAYGQGENMSSTIDFAIGYTLPASLTDIVSVTLVDEFPSVLTYRPVQAR